MPQTAPTASPATRSLPGSPLLEAVRQRQVRPCQVLLQQWVHRHGLSSLNEVCVELMHDQGEPALHWFLELMARDPSLRPSPGAAAEPPAIDTAAVAPTVESPRAEGWRHEHPVAAEETPPSQAPMAATLPPADSPQAGSPGAAAPAAVPLPPASASVQPGQPSPVAGEEWQARAQAAVNDAFAALAESFPEVLPQTATGPVAAATTAAPQPPSKPLQAESAPSMTPEAPTLGESAPSPVSRPMGAEPTGEGPPPLTAGTMEAPMTPPAPPLPRVIPYPPSPIFPAAPGARLGSPAPQSPRARLIAVPPVPALASSAAAAATDEPATASAPPSAADTPSAPPPPPSAQPAPTTTPSAETWTASLLEAPGHPGEAVAQEPDTLEAGSRAIPSLQALQQGFSQLGGRLARQGQTRLTHLRTLMRDCVEETVSLLRHPPEEQEPTAAAPVPPPATPTFSARPRASSAVTRSSGNAARPGAPLPSRENAAAASKPRPVELSSDRTRLKRAVARAEVPGGRRAPAPSALSDLRAWLPDQSENRRVS